MGIGLLSGSVGLVSALISMFIPGITLLESAAIYGIMVLASLTLSIALSILPDDLSALTR